MYSVAVNPASQTAAARRVMQRPCIPALPWRFNMVAQKDICWRGGAPPIQHDALLQCLKGLPLYSQKIDVVIDLPDYVTDSYWDVFHSLSFVYVFLPPDLPTACSSPPLLPSPIVPLRLRPSLPARRR